MTPLTPYHFPHGTVNRRIFCCPSVGTEDLSLWSILPWSQCLPLLYDDVNTCFIRERRMFRFRHVDSTGGTFVISGTRANVCRTGGLYRKAFFGVKFLGMSCDKLYCSRHFCFPAQLVGNFTFSALRICKPPLLIELNRRWAARRGYSRTLLPRSACRYVWR